ncbi:hypothetical protein [Pseudoalteromonas luteoviolacea]|uniref:Tail fiber protein n=1 Tax=Pseudoalteromonas luteoviolacea NCIMB 1942 TaxID=1365253 RepID=A0A166Z6U6_9GAMM|nr:hypothetical protein [Pseudoalteromonas luteoviolacea]KZN43999.1 tail fiber protein [Pseudoalteromonas luteoviolacea NCIMB 1942]
MNLKLQFTEAGLAACLSAKDKGLKAQVTHMAFGANAYTPSKNQTSLSKEQERVEVSDFEEQGNQLRIAGAFTGEFEYPIREIGIYCGDVLLGVYSQPNKLLGYRTPAVKVVQWFTLGIEALPTGSITVLVGTNNLNLILDSEFITGGLAFVKNQTALVKQAHWNLRLSEKIRQMESSI